MSDEQFLSRWSRRKREAAQEEAQSERTPPAAETAPPATDAANRNEETVASCAPGESPVAPFDPASLPPIESIGADSNIAAFLAEQVPAEIKRAALRRAWASDPAIRDFVGLQENDWDFTKPETIPGFGGAIAEHDVQDMVRRVFGEVVEPVTAEGDPLPQPTTPQAESGPEPQSTRLSERTPATESDAEADPAASPHAEVPEDQSAAALVQRNKSSEEVPERHASQPRQRQHGGALPRCDVEPDNGS